MKKVTQCTVEQTNPFKHDFTDHVFIVMVSVDFTDHDLIVVVSGDFTDHDLTVVAIGDFY